MYISEKNLLSFCLETGPARAHRDREPPRQGVRDQAALRGGGGPAQAQRAQPVLRQDADGLRHAVTGRPLPTPAHLPVASHPQRGRGAPRGEHDHQEQADQIYHRLALRLRAAALQTGGPRDGGLQGQAQRSRPGHERVQRAGKGAHAPRGLRDGAQDGSQEYGKGHPRAVQVQGHQDAGQEPDHGRHGHEAGQQGGAEGGGDRAVQHQAPPPERLRARRGSILQGEDRQLMDRRLRWCVLAFVCPSVARTPREIDIGSLPLAHSYWDLSAGATRPVLKNNVDLGLNFQPFIL